MPPSELASTSKGINLMLSILGFIAVIDGFLLANGFFQSGAVYLGISLLGGALIYFLVNRIRKRLSVYGVGRDYIADISWGVLAGFAIILLQPVFGLSLGIPLENLALSAQWIIVVFIAPIAEEVLFRVGLYNILTISFNIAPLISNVIQALFFSFYHIQVYANEISASAILSVQSAFIAAFIAGILFEYIYLWRKSFLAPVGAHMAYNAIKFAALNLAFGV